MLLCTSGVKNPWGNRRAMLVLRGSLGYATLTCLYTACTLMPLADVTTLTFLAPLFVAVLSPVLLKENPSTGALVTIPVCFFGVLLITQPAFLFGQNHERFSTLGICFGLLQPFFSAIAKVRPDIDCAGIPCNKHVNTCHMMLLSRRAPVLSGVDCKTSFF